MSRVVRSVTRAVGRVVNGVGNVVAKVTGSKTLGRIARAVAVAATIYFGSAAIMGGIGGMSAGGAGFFSGAGTGIANAWTGLKAAGSAAMGGNFAQAGSHLGAGIQGNVVPPPGVVPAGQLSPLSVADPTSPFNIEAGVQPSGAFTQPVTNQIINPGAPIKPSIWRTNTGAATVIAAGNIGAGLIEGAGKDAALKDQRAYESEQERLKRELEEQNMSGQVAVAQARDSDFVPDPVNQNFVRGTPTQVSSGPRFVQNNGLISSQVNDPTQNYVYEFPIHNPNLRRFYG